VNGIGRPQFGMRSSLAAALLNFCLSTALMPLCGYFGVVVGTAVSMVCAALYFLAMAHRAIGLPPGPLWRALLPKPLFAAFPAGLLLQLMPPPTTGLELAASGAGYLILFGLGTWVSGYFDPYDFDLFERHVRARVSIGKTSATAAAKGKT